MAIQVGGTTVIDDSRNLSNVGGLKTVNGTSILGSGNISAGGLEEVISTTTIGSAVSSLVLSWNNTGYEMIKLEFKNFIPSATSSVFFRMQVSSNGGSTFYSGSNDYKIATFFTNQSINQFQVTAGTNNNLLMSYGSGNHVQGNNTSAYLGAWLSGEITLLNPGETTKPTFFLGRHFYGNITTYYMSQAFTSGFLPPANAATNAVKFFYDGANITSGQVRVVGVKR